MSYWSPPWWWRLNRREKTWNQLPKSGENSQKLLSTNCQCRNSEIWRWSSSLVLLVEVVARLCWSFALSCCGTWSIGASRRDPLGWHPFGLNYGTTDQIGFISYSETINWWRWIIYQMRCWLIGKKQQLTNLGRKTRRTDVDLHAAFGVASFQCDPYKN